MNHYLSWAQQFYLLKAFQSGLINVIYFPYTGGGIGKQIILKSKHKWKLNIKATPYSK